MSDKKRDFSKEASMWDENPMRVRITSDIGDSIIANVKLTDKMDVLDFGCGTGLLSFKLALLVKSIVGVDSAQGMLDVFNDKIKKLGIDNAKAELLDVDKNEILTGTYSLITSSMSFHHIKDIVGLLRQMYNALKSNGVLAVADLEPDNGKFHEDNTGVYHNGFDLTEFKELLEQTGFKDVRFFPATKITRPSSDGKPNVFKVFLAIARK